MKSISVIASAAWQSSVLRWIAEPALSVAKGLVLLAMTYTTAHASPRVLLEHPETLTSLAIGTGTMIVSGERDVWRFSLGAGDPKETAHYQAPVGNRIIHLDAIDLDRDGQEDALVTAVQDDDIVSFILFGTANGQWKASDHRYDRYFRVLADCSGVVFHEPPTTNHESPCLLGQRGRNGQRFAGPIVPLRWDGGTLRAGARISLPRPTTLYNFQPLADGKTMTVVAANGQVQLWERDGDRWRMAEHFPRRYAALRAVCLPPAQTSYAANDLAAAECLPMPLHVRGKQLFWFAQTPAMGNAVGRVPYWRSREAVTATQEAGEWALRANEAGAGAVADIASSAKGELFAIIQRGRDEPFAAPGKSQVVVLSGEGGTGFQPSQPKLLRRSRLAGPHDPMMSGHNIVRP